MNPAVCVPTLYNALPEEIRAIRGYRDVSALKKIVNTKKYYSHDELLNACVLLLEPLLSLGQICKFHSVHFLFTDTNIYIVAGVIV
jgi:hypothetical protein